MTVQLIEIYSLNKTTELLKSLSQLQLEPDQIFQVNEHHPIIRLFIDETESEAVLNKLEVLVSNDASFKACLIPIQATLPKPKEVQPVPTKNAFKKDPFDRASKQELLALVQSGSTLNSSFVWFAILAAVIAIIGMIKSSAGFVIGANVIDPLIGPATGISFASVIGDHRLIRKSIFTSCLGLLIPLTLSFLSGLLLPLPKTSHEFLAETNIHVIDVVVAFAAGAAGALSFIKRLPGTLVGVTVSITILPPTVVLGMMLGGGDFSTAVMPLLLIIVNLNAILLSGCLIFWLSGIKPTRWMNLESANTSRTFAILFTSTISFITIAGIVLLHL